jgi:hypothetical protein
VRWLYITDFDHQISLGYREKAKKAEECFHKAIEIARQQQAKSLELRAVMSLVRLRQQQATHASRNTQHEARNRLDDAHALLTIGASWSQTKLG